MTTSWTQHLWSDVQDIYRSILAHPFIAGLTDGSLPDDRFAYYVAQDAHYLREYARALAAVGVKAPTHAETAVFAEHAAATARVEIALHESLLPQLGLDPAELDTMPMSPTTVGYTSYLVDVAATRSYAEAAAAVLPCFWVYQSVGDALLAAGSPDPRYRLWIEQYGSEEFAASVAGVIALTDQIRATITDDQARRAAVHFRTATRFEWMFWDAAWRMETWPV